MNKKIWVYFLSILAVLAILAWLAAFSRPSENFQIIACDVGQGDAILLTKGDLQVLVDGGPGNRVISCLSRHMPFWDRKLEMVVLTHPDADHATGLVEVFRDYEINYFVTTEVNRDTNVYSTLREEVAESGAKVHFARKGQSLSIGDLYFDILHPPLTMLAYEPGYKENVLGSAAAEKANDLSVVLKVSYKSFSALLTGDIETNISDILAESFTLSDIRYLKVPHHGSKNGLSQKLFDEVSPEVVVISVGANNRFGHPHEEVLEILRRGVINHAPIILRTDEIGDVVIETNGQAWWRKM